MPLTNSMNLPAPIVEKLRSFDHDNGAAEASVTGLLLPARLATLLEHYRDEITEDASDRIWALFGHLMAVMLERAAPEGSVAEKRLYTDALGWRISGTLDHFSIADGILDDYKVTSVWVVKNGGKTEWEPQLNLYAMLVREWLAEKKGTALEVRLDVVALRVVAFLRDWSVREAERDPSYPQTQVVLIDIPLWDEARCRAFLAERVAVHQQARAAFQDGVLPLCTPEEKWQKPDVWAVMKTGQERAHRVCDTPEKAYNIAGLLPKGSWSVVKRPGVAVRCQSYCAVARFCAARDDAGFGPADIPTAIGE